ncbi:MAG: class I SAM-dependent methyltransferase [Anaerolineae bacterium]
MASDLNLKTSAVQSERAAEVGGKTLELMAELETFNRWMFDSLAPYIGQRVLEAGAGIGNFTHLLTDRELVVALELEPERVADLRERFAAYPNVRAEVGDLSDPSLLQLAEWDFDTILCLNVLEHIENDEAALKYMRGVLAPQGRLLLLVPAHPWLYSSLDENLGHFRRYAEADLRTKLEDAGYEIERCFYINLAGIAGWALNGRVLKRHELPSGQLQLYERMAPLFRKVEQALGLRWGLSVVFVARNPGR